MNIVQRFGINEKGKDYIVGDIHGCMKTFKRGLIELGFNKAVDRVFALGDLIDRGSYNIEAVQLLSNDWFFSVMGNHEDMFMRTLTGELDKGNYFYNGGSWIEDEDELTLRAVYHMLDRLPFVIELDTIHGKYGLVHGDVNSTYWDVFIRELETKANAIDAAIWGRGRITRLISTTISGIDKVFLGHTIVEVPTKLGNTYYIDTGSFLNNGGITFWDVKEDRFHYVGNREHESDYAD